MNYQFQLSPTQSFDYRVKRQKRKTMALHIMPDASVEIRIPKWVPKREWLKFLESRVDWVVEQQAVVQKKLMLQPGYTQGEYHPYLGKRYVLNISAATRSLVSLNDDVLQIQVRNPEDSNHIQKALEKWLRCQAQIVFEKRIRYCYSLFPQNFQSTYAIPTVTLRSMRRRWGSCSQQGNVTLNVQLIKMPLECIDYVVMHELCHLAQFNHSAAFYKLLTHVMPDWAMRKKTLEAQQV